MKISQSNYCEYLVNQSTLADHWVAVKELKIKLPEYGYIVNNMVLVNGNFRLNSLTATQIRFVGSACSGSWAQLAAVAQLASCRVSVRAP